jgi:hypothetical protein
MSNPDFVMTQRRGDEDGLAVSRQPVWRKLEPCEDVRHFQLGGEGRDSIVGTLY